MRRLTRRTEPWIGRTLTLDDGTARPVPCVVVKAILGGVPRPIALHNEVAEKRFSVSSPEWARPGPLTNPENARSELEHFADFAISMPPA